MNGYGGAVESMVWKSCSDLPAEGGQVWLGCSTPDAGGYGVLRIDPWDGIQVQLFGWDRLTPGSSCEDTRAIAALLRYTFVFDGVDWTWRRPFTAAMVPVAAHLVARILVDTWAIHPGTIDEELLDVRAIDPGTDNGGCDRCLRPECAGHG